MARKVEYICDECDKSFGDNMHLNLKSGELRYSFMKQATGIWAQKKINAGVCNKEYHFCDGTCFCQWILKKIKETELSILPPNPVC